MEKVVLNAYAKINPFLEITGKRADGYHEIDSLMMSLSLYDTVTLTKTDSGISITADVAGVPTDKRNIAYKAARVLLDVCTDACGVHIDIKKRIPTEAGMGGGSADGAAVLVGLNKLLGEPFSTDELCAFGATVGADIPFCVRGGCIRVVGIGDVVVEQLPVPKLHILVAKGREGISTPAAYAALDSRHADFCGYVPRIPADILTSIKNGDQSGIACGFYNIFEQALDALAPSAKALKDRLAALSRGALLCGSGTAVFAVFDNEPQAYEAKDLLFKDGLISFAEVCTTKPCGVEFV